VTPLSRPHRDGRPYLGYRETDYNTPFAKYFDSKPTLVSAEVLEALAFGAQAPPLFCELTEAASLLEDGHSDVETGFAVGRDRSITVAVRTEMPRVTPDMWDWWFGWHGSDSRRYKLWNPRAHLFVQWADGPDAGRRGRSRYVGRTSFVDEYIGATLLRGAISFVEPRELGFDQALLTDPTTQTVVCARVGSSDVPVDVGYLVHHVRKTDRGSEMRSRFWMGGRHVSVRSNMGGLGRFASSPARLGYRPDARAATELLAHCAQEMTHLAVFLPELFDEFKDE
jgi:hypothetical protein